jgi:hypothetical protein
MLIFYVRPARCKARAVATMEALSLLRDLHVVAPAGGPLSGAGRSLLDNRSKSYLDAPINRKGLDVAALAWQKEA